MRPLTKPSEKECNTMEKNDPRHKGREKRVREKKSQREIKLCVKQEFTFIK